MELYIRFCSATPSNPDMGLIHSDFDLRTFERNFTDNYMFPHVSLNQAKKVINVISSNMKSSHDHRY